MTSGQAPTDAAWVAIEVPIAPEKLRAFCRDLERLYRINPYLEFRAWKPAPHGAVTVFRNLSNGREYALELRVERPSATGFTVHYDRGIKRATRFTIEPLSGAGSRLTITDDYTGTGPDSDLKEVDRSLRAWGVALREYLQREARWGHCGVWRWYMRRVWLPMKPSARRITFIILMITLAEVALFSLAMAVYWAESNR